MAIIITPIKDATTLGNFSRIVALDGVNYKLTFNYNSRDDYWYFSISDTEDNPIKSGYRLVSSWAQLHTLRNTPRPPGEIITIDTRSTPLDPGFEDLGTNVLIGYVEEDSLP